MASLLRNASPLRRSLFLDTQESRRGLLETPALLLRHFSAKVVDGKETFFVVRKGDLIGVYKSLSDCQAQVGTSQPSLRDETSKEPMIQKEQETVSSGGYGQSCILEFDGAYEGNQAGAGAILRADNGRIICRLSEGLGVASKNVAVYRALILGLRVALEKGFTSIRARGDYRQVCMQMQGLCKFRNKYIDIVYEALNLKHMFTSFKIIHVRRELNADADAQANLAVDLAAGQVTEAFE